VSEADVCSLYPQGAVAAMLSPLSTGEPPYTAWVAAYNTSFLLGYLLLAPAPRARTVYSPHSKLKSASPSQPNLDNSSSQGTMRDRSGELSETATLLEAGTAMASLYFYCILFKLGTPQTRLIIGLSCPAQAKQATGLINLSMRTMDASDKHAMIILSLVYSRICYFAG